MISTPTEYEPDHESEQPGTEWFTIFVQFKSGRRKRWQQCWEIEHLESELLFKTLQAPRFASQGFRVILNLDEIEYHTLELTSITYTTS